MRNIITGVLIGLIIGSVAVAVIGSQYYIYQIESINENKQTESQSIKDIFREQIDNINQLLDNSLSDYADLESDFQKLQNDFDELSEKYNELMDDYSLILGELPLTQDRTSTELVRKDYQWNYLGKTWELSISIPSSISDFYETHE
ncbi:hypothetical protein ACFL0D_09590, partial [Thermoproteota archaeon]